MIVDAETTPFVDVTAARMLAAAHEELRRRGVRLVLPAPSGRCWMCSGASATIAT